jgi:hypothetical protein
MRNIRFFRRCASLVIQSNLSWLRSTPGKRRKRIIGQRAAQKKGKRKIGQPPEKEAKENWAAEADRKRTKRRMGQPGADQKKGKGIFGQPGAAQKKGDKDNWAPRGSPEK